MPQPQTFKISKNSIPPQILSYFTSKETGKFEYTGEFSKAERRVLKKPKPGKGSDWPEKFRTVTEGKLPGKWHNKITPYLKGLMDAAANRMSVLL